MTSPARKGLYLVSTAAVVAFGLGTQVVSAGAATLGNDAYTALTPCRVQPATTVTAGGTLSVSVVGTFCGETVPASAQAVVVNATVTNGTSNGYVTVYPKGAASSVSTLNYAAGETIANLATVGVGSGGDLAVYDGAGSGSVQVVLDLEGYYAPAATAAGYYVPLSPARVATLTSIGAGQTANVQITGKGGVPSAGVSAVVFNLTATNGTAGSYLTAYPTGATRPTASNLNFGPGETIPNRVIVPVGTGGQVTLYNAAGTVQIDADVDGYYTDASGASGVVGDLFTPLSSPIRLLDTRTSGGAIGAGQSVTLAVGGVDGISSSAVAAAENVTETGATAGSYFTVYPSGASRPTASDLNFGPGETIPNYTQATLGGGKEAIFNVAGSANAVVDVFGYFAPQSGYLVTVTAATNPVAANATSLISYTITNNGAALAAADPVYATVTGTGCGTITSTNPTSSSLTGTGTFTYTASATSATCIVTVTEADGGTSGSITLTQTANNTVAVSAAANPIAANGTSTSAITAAVSGPNFNPATQSETVTFTMAGTPSGACSGRLSSTSGPTNLSGDVTVTYLSSTTSGFCTITATEQATSPGTGQSGSVTIDQTTSPTPGNTPYTVTFSPVSATLSANGTSTQSFTVTVANSTPAAVSGDPVSLSTTGTGCGTLSATGGTTDSLGQVAFTYTAGTSAGICTIHAQEASTGLARTAAVTQTATNSVTVTASPTSVQAGQSTTTSTVTALVTSPTGAVLAGKAITWSVTGSGCGTVSPTSGTTSGTGLTTTYTAGSTAGFCTVTADDTTDTLTGSVAITQNSPAPPGHPTGVSVTVASSSLQATGTSTTTVSVTVSSSNGGGLSGDPVQLTVSPSATCGTLSSASFTTNSSGQNPSTITYTTSTTAATCTITATEADGNPNSLSGTATITQTANNSVTVVSQSIAVNGGPTETVTVDNQLGNPVANDSLTLTGASFPTGTCGSGAIPATGTTNSSGQFSFTYLADSTVGFCTITVKEALTSQTGSGVITQTAVPTTAYTLGLGASSTTLNKGTMTSTVTATLSSAVSGDPVMFTLSGASCGTLSASTGTTNASGKVVVTYTTAATAGQCTVGASEASNGAAATGVLILQNNTISVTANPTAVAGGGTSTITATVWSPNGTPLAGDTVNFVPSAGTVSPASGTTNSSGQTTTTFTAPATAGFPTVTGVESGTGQSSSVTLTVS